MVKSIFVAISALALNCMSCVFHYIPANVKCVTKCGMMLDSDLPAPRDGGGFAMSWYDSPEDYWTCENLQNAENEIIETYAQLIQPELETSGNFKADTMCDHLYGYTVKVAPTWHFEFGSDDLLGLTQCIRKLVVVNNLPWHMSSLTHELAHVIQDCGALPPDENVCKNPELTPEDERACGGHYNWPINGVDATALMIRLNHQVKE